jgi:hypothetical protein
MLCCAILQDAAGHHSSALFVQWVPYELAGTTWEDEEEKYVQHLINIVDDFAPGTPQLGLLGKQPLLVLMCHSTIPTLTAASRAVTTVQLSCDRKLSASPPPPVSC